MRKPRLLWIEDETQHEMHGFVGPLYASWEFEIVIAADASDAMRALKSGSFDVIVVDIRIAPGDDELWVGIYNDHDADPANAKLGVVLLEILLGSKRVVERRYRLPNGKSYSIESLGDIPEIRASRVGVFSVEADDLKADLAGLGVRHILAKRARLPRLALLDFVRNILAANPDESD